MRKGGSSSGRMMEVPVVVGGGQGYLNNLGCQLLYAPQEVKMSWDGKETTAGVMI